MHLLQVEYTGYTLEGFARYVQTPLGTKFVRYFIPVSQRSLDPEWSTETASSYLTCAETAEDAGEEESRIFNKLTLMKQKPNKIFQIIFSSYFNIILSLIIIIHSSYIWSTLFPPRSCNDLLGWLYVSNFLQEICSEGRSVPGLG